MLIPLNDYVLVKPIKEDTKTSYGIITSPTSKEKPGKGRVIAIGEGRKNDDGNTIKIDCIKIGDTIYFTKYSPEELDLNNEKYLLVKIDSVIAKK